MSTAWVIGSRGLLGSALCRALQLTETNEFTPIELFRWASEPEFTVQLEAAIKVFAAFVGVGAQNDWQIYYWAAGVGTMSSSEAELAIETQVMSTLLNLVESKPGLIGTKGCFAFASSVGAVYAGATDDIISENMLAAPTTAYAQEKLKQENLISAFAITNCKVTALLARISTLYGPGQATGKQQGLIAEIARRILHNQPLQIYEPFDTIRDYIAAHDAAVAIVAAIRAIISRKPGVITKIIASEQPVTIAEIISIYKRIARRTPRVATSASKLSSIYIRRIQFHSIANEQTLRTSLLVGIAHIMAAKRLVFVRSQA